MGPSMGGVPPAANPMQAPQTPAPQINPMVLRALGLFGSGPSIGNAVANQQTPVPSMSAPAASPGGFSMPSAGGWARIAQQLAGPQQQQAPMPMPQPPQRMPRQAPPRLSTSIDLSTAFKALK